MFKIIVVLHLGLWVGDLAPFDFKHGFYTRPIGDLQISLVEDLAELSGFLCLSCFLTNLVFNQLKFTNWFEGPIMFEKLRDTRRNHPALISCEHNFAVLIYDQRQFSNPANLPGAPQTLQDLGKTRSIYVSEANILQKIQSIKISIVGAWKLDSRCLEITYRVSCLRRIRFWGRTCANPLSSAQNSETPFWKH